MKKLAIAKGEEVLWDSHTIGLGQDVLNSLLNYAEHSCQL